MQEWAQRGKTWASEGIRKQSESLGLWKTKILQTDGFSFPTISSGDSCFQLYSSAKRLCRWIHLKGPSQERAVCQINLVKKTTWSFSSWNKFHLVLKLKPALNSRAEIPARPFISQDRSPNREIPPVPRGYNCRYYHNLPYSMPTCDWI